MHSVMAYCIILVRLVGTIKFKFSNVHVCMLHAHNYVWMGLVLLCCCQGKDGFQLARCNYSWIDDMVIAF